MLKFVFAIFLPCLSLLAADGPYKLKSNISSEIINKLASANAKKQFSFRTFVPGVGGVKFNIQRRRIFNHETKVVGKNTSYTIPNTSTLYQGSVKSHEGSLPVAFSFIPDGKKRNLEITFLGKNRSRIHKLILNDSDAWQSINVKHPRVAENINKCSVKSEHNTSNNISTSTSQAASTYSELDLAIDADKDFYDSFDASTANPTDQLAAASAKIDANLNAAEVLYIRDLFLKFKLVQKQILTNINFGTTDANDRLDTYGQYISDEDVAGRLVVSDVYHLFTRSLAGGTAGLAYVGVVCSPFNYSTGVTEGTSSSASFIFAHEVGHNLGANHDEGSNCGSSTGIMSPVLSGSTPKIFSSCSISSIDAHLAGEPDCLADYTGTIPPTPGASPIPSPSDPAANPSVTLKSSLDPKGNFVLKVNTSVPGCDISIKAARTASLLNTSTAIYNSVLATSAAQFSGRIGRRSADADSRSIASTVKLRVDATCSGIAIKSNRVTLRSDRINSSKKMTTVKWINRLKQLLALQ